MKDCQIQRLLYLFPAGHVHAHSDIKSMVLAVVLADLVGLICKDYPRRIAIIHVGWKGSRWTSGGGRIVELAYVKACGAGCLVNVEGLQRDVLGWAHQGIGYGYARGAPIDSCVEALVIDSDV